MGCPAPDAVGPQRAVTALANEIQVRLRPTTSAYHEIWIDGSKVASSEPVDPLYGETYLPRKFKTGIALTTDNCIDVYAQDAGLIGLVDGDAVDRWVVTVGGGLGMTHGKGDTIARLADPVGVVDTANAVESIAIIVGIFRDHGNRADRRHARIKYLIEEWGIEKFREEFRARAAFRVDDAPAMTPIPFHDHLETVQQPDGRWTHGVFVLSGRVADTPTLKSKTALQRIAREVAPRFVFTAQQSVLLADLDEAGLARAQAILAEHGVGAVDSLSGARRYAMACPALPTCGLALAESERAIPGILDALDATLGALGLRDAAFTVRMTGCPNGCARPYTADLAFVGRSADLYHVYVGGRLEGDRVADLYAADVPAAELLTRVTPLLERWASERTSAEGLGDFYHRALDSSGQRRRVTGRELPTLTQLFPA
jgi:sulfite reductase beta subunit-like hemoprotein